MTSSVTSRISEPQISTLVDTFYAKVRQDPEIGPIFNAAIDDWPAHLALLKNFWSTVLLTTGRYKGDPMMTHLSLPIEEKHFARWLQLFEQTATEILPPPIAANIVNKAHRIAGNFKLGIAFHRQSSSSTA